MWPWTLNLPQNRLGSYPLMTESTQLYFKTTAYLGLSKLGWGARIGPAALDPKGGAYAPRLVHFWAKTSPHRCHATRAKFNKIWAKIVHVL